MESEHFGSFYLADSSTKNYGVVWLKLAYTHVEFNEFGGSLMLAATVALDYELCCTLKKSHWNTLENYGML